MTSFAATPTDSLSLRHYGPSHGSHAHGEFQVLLALDGVLDLEVQGRGLRIAAGQGCVIAPGERHDFESRSGSRCLVLDTADAGWAPRVTIAPDAAQALALGRYLEQSLRRGGLALRLAPSLLLDAWAQAATPIAPRPQRRIDWPQLTAWAQAHLHQPLTVASLAAQVHLSPTQFAARCRSQTGLSVMQWLRRERLARAQVLRAGGMKLADAALQCGYLSPSALTAALRRGR